MAVALVVALLFAAPALIRVGSAAIDGEGITSAAHDIGGVAMSEPVPHLLAAALGLLVNPDWNVLLSVRFTPPLWLGLAAIGLMVLLRSRPLIGLAVLIGSVSQLLCYTPLRSTVLHFGEMRYQITVLPWLLLPAGQGAVSMVALVGSAGMARTHRACMPLVSAAFVLAAGLSLVPYAPMIRWAKHPAAQEYRVLREAVLDAHLARQRGATVLFAPEEPRAFGDIHDVQPDEMEPLLVDRDLEMRSGRWPELPALLAAGTPAKDILIYRGLYLHYLAAHDSSGLDSGSDDRSKDDAAFTRRLRGFGIDPGALRPLFLSRVPFIVHHTLLDPPVGPGTFTVALYRFAPGR